MVTARNINMTQVLGMTQQGRQRRTKRIANATFKVWRDMTRGLPARFRGPYNAAMRIEVNALRGTFKLQLDTHGRNGTLVRSIEYG